MAAATASATGEATAFRPAALRGPDRFRVSVTWLDAIIRWKAEMLSTEELLRRFSRKSTAGPMAIAGRKMHSLLETHGTNLRLEHLAAEGFDVAPRNTLRFPMTGREEREVKVVSDRFHRRVRLIGIADLVAPDRVTDWKFTSRPDMVAFAEAMQWRCYLAMMGRSKFRYGVYQMMQQRYDPERFLLFEGHSLDLYYHKDLEDQVRAAVREAVFLLERFCASGELDIMKVAQHPLSYCPYCGANHMRLAPAEGKPSGKAVGWSYACEACSPTFREVEHTRPRKRRFQDA